VPVPVGEWPTRCGAHAGGGRVRRGFSIHQTTSRRASQRDRRPAGPARVVCRPSRFCGGGVPERNIRADALDAFVFDQIRAAMTHPDQLLRLLIEDVRVTGWHVQIRLRIALDPPPQHPTAPTAPTGPPPPHPEPVSTKDGLRSVGDHRRRVLHPALGLKCRLEVTASWEGRGGCERVRPG